MKISRKYPRTRKKKCLKKKEYQPRILHPVRLGLRIKKFTTKVTSDFKKKCYDRMEEKKT